jgi:hypothetical protein
VHGALFVQTINDVAQGHHAQFARISIVIIIIERLFGEREREKGMFIMYTFVLRLCAVERKNAHAFVYGHKAQK